MLKTAVALLAVALGVGMVGCGGSAPVAPSAQLVPTPTSTRVAIISIDGLRPDALQAAGAVNILALANRGAFSWQAQTILPSNTLPAHVSMLSGFTPDRHGITWDDYLPARGRITVPTLFSIAYARGLRSVIIAGKEKFKHFRDTGAGEFMLSTAGDADVATQAIGAGMTGADLIFVHLPDVDLAGHARRWMSETYYASVRQADEAVGRIAGFLPADMTIILTADHGGRPEGHGTNAALDTTIPWIIAGPTIVMGRQLATPVRTVDTAATTAFILGIELPPDAAGRVVTEAFAVR